MTVVAAGITTHEAVKAADELKSQGISVRVIDCYSVKPMDSATVVASVHATAGRLLVVEDHWAEGGIGEAVLTALATAGPTCLDVALPAPCGAGYARVRQTSRAARRCRDLCRSHRCRGAAIASGRLILMTGPSCGPLESVLASTLMGPTTLSLQYFGVGRVDHPSA